jgi:hypothetical protein
MLGLSINHIIYIYIHNMYVYILGLSAAAASVRGAREAEETDLQRLLSLRSSGVESRLLEAILSRCVCACVRVCVCLCACACGMYT